MLVQTIFLASSLQFTHYVLLLLLCAGAGGAEVMFHSRAARELGLLDHEDEQYKGWGEVSL
jgi:hypothetical protein